MASLPAALRNVRGRGKSAPPVVAADRFALAAELVASLAGACAADGESALRQSLEAVLEELGAVRASIVELAFTPEALKPIVTVAAARAGRAWHDRAPPRSVRWLAARIAAREVVHVAEPRLGSAAEALDALAPRALWVAPLQAGSRDLGALVLECERLAAPPDARSGRQLLVSVGAAIAALLERRRVSAREASHRLLEAIELMPGVLCQAYYSGAGRLELKAIAGTPTTGLAPAAIFADPRVLLERIEPSDRARLFATLEESAGSGRPWSLDFRVTNLQGERRWISARALPQRLPDGGTLFTGLALDITAQKRVEATLLVSEARYRALFDSAPLMMHAVDAAGRIVNVNRKWLARLGYELIEAIGQRTSAFLAEDSHPALLECEQQLQRTGAVAQLPCRMVTRGGEVLDVVLSARAERGAGGEIIAATYCFVDATELNRALEALRESEARYRAIVHDQSELICRFDARGVLQFVNHAVVRLTGREILDLVGSDWFSLLEPEHRRTLRRRLKSLTPRRPQLVVELPMADIERWYQWIVRAFFDDGGALKGYQAVGRDIQELKSLEQQIRDISHREQSRIGHDLHDGLGQELTGATLLAKTLELDAKREAPALHERLRSLREVIERATASTRAIAQGLSPIGIEREGLVEALRQLAQRTETVYGIAVEFTGRKGVLRDPSVALDLYRIAQEALSNAAKHSGGSRIALDLTVGRKAVELTIADDGRGLGEEAARAPGMGLQIMQHRASMIGATLELLPGEQGGTAVRCVLRQQPIGDERKGRSI